MRTLSLLLGAASLIGCASPQQTFTELIVHDPLLTVHSAIAAGNLRAARSELIAIEVDQLNENRSQVKTLLLSELALQNGDVVKATELALPIYSSDSSQPQAAELLGKAHLQAGRFDHALQYFGTAQGNYSLHSDKTRVSDLSHLTHALQAYGDGDFAGAQRHWSAITDRALMQQVEDKFAVVINAE
jgi:TolA-binding protein